MMKKSILLTAIAMLFCVAATYAQDFSIFGGLNISMIQERDNNGVYSDEYKNLAGPNGGFKVAFETDNDQFFETGLFLSNKGFRMDIEEYIEGELVKADATVSLYYLEAPLNFKSTMSADNNINLYFNYGVFLGIGIDARMKMKVNAMGETIDETIALDFGNDPEEDFFKQFDLGVNFGAGVEISRVIVGLNYSYGVLNVSPYSDGGYKNRTRAFSIMLGYKFPSKKPDPLSTPKQSL